MTARVQMPPNGIRRALGRIECAGTLLATDFLEVVEHEDLPLMPQFVFPATVLDVTAWAERDRPIQRARSILAIEICTSESCGTLGHWAPLRNSRGEQVVTVVESGGLVLFPRERHDDVLAAQRDRETASAVLCGSLDEGAVRINGDALVVQVDPDAYQCWERVDAAGRRGAVLIDVALP